MHVYYYSSPVVVIITMSMMMMVFHMTSAQFLQEFVPGLDYETEQEDGVEQQETAEYLACGKGWETMEATPDVKAAWDALNLAVTDKYSQTNPCVEKETEMICVIDYAMGTLSENYKSACTTNGGIYLENSHAWACNLFDLRTDSRTFNNYPYCFPPTCESADMQRLIEAYGDALEGELENVYGRPVCDSDASVEISPQEEEERKAKICPNVSKNTYESCSPLFDNIQKQDCDCYSFCDGVLIDCSLFGSDGTNSDIFCPGDLIMGCTADLFVKSAAARLWLSGTVSLGVVSMMMWSMMII